MKKKKQFQIIFNTLGSRRQIVCSLVYINNSIWIYKNKAVDQKKLLIATMCIVCDQNLDFGDEKRKWTDPGIIIITTPCLLVTILLITFANGLDKISFNKILVVFVLI